LRTTRSSSATASIYRSVELPSACGWVSDQKQ
jgi:hypothetical protein